MNPELERRLRQFGATVDAAADVEDARRRATAAAPDESTIARLDAVVVLGRQPHRFYRAIAAAAAAVAVVAGGIAFAVGRTGPSTGIADRPITPTPAAVTDSTETATTEPVEVAPVTTVLSTTTTTTSVPVSSTAPATELPQTRPSTPAVCPSYTPNNDYHLGICDSGPAIRLAQERLRASIDSSLNVDGYFGPGTRNAVRTFQQLHGLSVDGYIGPLTWAALVPDAPGTDVDGSGIVDPDEISTD
jgi:Putative peptidoglycan binding domain